MTTLHVARELAHTLGQDRRPAAETVPLGRALGRTLARPAVARVTVPGTDTSAMDGWVVCGPGPWQVDGAVRMGAEPGDALRPGTARAVTTGGAVPPGTTAVLRSEHGRVVGDRLLGPDAPLRPALDVRRAGEEVTIGDVVAPAGARVTPAVVAAGAVAGLDVLTVRRRPRAALVQLGDEVVTSGVPAPGQVRDAYGVLLPSVLDQAGVGVVDVRHVRDTPAAVRAALDRPDVDLVVTTGGTGHGSADHLVPALDDLDADVLVRGVAMRPGHPTVLGRIGDVPVLGLPGNPFAAVVALVLLGLPLVAGLLDAPCPGPRWRTAAVDLPGCSTGVQVLATAETPAGLVPVDRQGAAMLRGLVDADALALVGPEGVAAGGRVPVHPLPWR